MMLDEQSVDYSVKYQQLLFDLKITVEGLLAGGVVNVWSIYGGLNRLFNAIEKIFKHGCKSVCEDGTSAYWKFIQGIDWLQPNNNKFSLALDCEFKSYLPQSLKSDKASIWLYRSIESHSLSQKLSWLLSDKSHLHSCYQEQAFLCQEKYAEAILICLQAVELNQPSLVTDINPNLFVTKTNVKEYHKIHRRCASNPDNLPKNLGHHRNRSLHNLKLFNSQTEKTKIIHGKFKSWNSLPDLSGKKKVTESISRTAPATPVHTRHAAAKKLSESQKIDTSVKKKVKHVIINNQDIIEHTPHMIDSDLPSALYDENLSIRSMPGSTKSSMHTINLGKSMPDYSFISALSGEKDYKRKPKQTFIEGGGRGVLPMATGYFPRPTKGQTLVSFLTASQFARGNAELDRENAHFSISEAIISAIEQMNCSKHLKLAEDIVEESDEEIMDLKQRIRLRRRQKLEERQNLSMKKIEDRGAASPYSISPKSQSESFSSEDVDDLEIDEASNLIDHRGLSMSMASLYSDADLFKKPRGAPDGASDILSAESVALSLISRFNEKRLPRASDLEWLVSEEDAPQALLPLPKSWPINPDDLGESTITLLRGTHEWAPPRPQIIFTLPKRPDRKILMEKQNYRCAGCGMRVAIQYASKFRYCNYLGRYFCTGCHTNQVAVIPARVIQKWDFTRYAVSTFSYRLLEQMFVDPLFRIFELNKDIVKRSKNLERCRKYKIGLYYMKDFIYTCRFAKTVQDLLELENSYIISDPDVYSMKDFISIRSGEMKVKLSSLVNDCCTHIYECELCLARGFVCLVCLSDEIVFPWQLKSVRRCHKCGSCYHAACWNVKESPCLKCQRIDRRKQN